LPLLQKAAQANHAPRATAQLGFCQQSLGQWAEAETNVSAALAAEHDSWVTKNRAVLVSALATIKAHVGRIEVVGEPPNAEVFVNANAVGKLPLAAPIAVAAGEIDVELRAPGYVRVHKSFEVAAGQYQKVVLRLERESPPPEAMATPVTPAAQTAATSDAARVVAPASVAAPAAPVMVTTQTEAPSAEPSGARAAAKWVSWGIGVAGLGVGTYGVLRNRSQVTSFNANCAIDASGAPESTSPDKTAQQCADLKSGYEMGTKLAVAGFIGAAVFGAVGFILWATEPSGPPSMHASATPACAPQLGARGEPGVGCLFRF